MEMCRNCDAASMVDLGFCGEVAPFFLKRVLRLDRAVRPSLHPVKKFLQGLPLLPRLTRRLWGESDFVEMQICGVCRFIQIRHPFADDDLGRLYFDYRSESYNRERSHYEPQYSGISAEIGAAPEAIVRVARLTEWLTPKFTPSPQFSMLDFGGADGRFLPAIPGAKFVYEISDIEPVAGVTRVQGAPGRYSYLQIAHVLEHVSYPLALVRKAVSHLLPGGYLYVEVPKEIDENNLEQLLAGKRRTLGVHEHVNYYSPGAIAALFRALGLDIVAVDTETMDLGWSRPEVIRGLAKRPQS